MIIITESCSEDGRQAESVTVTDCWAPGSIWRTFATGIVSHSYRCVYPFLIEVVEYYAESLYGFTALPFANQRLLHTLSLRRITKHDTAFVYFRAGLQLCSYIPFK